VSITRVHVRAIVLSMDVDMNSRILAEYVLDGSAEYSIMLSNAIDFIHDFKRENARMPNRGSIRAFMRSQIYFVAYIVLHGANKNEKHITVVINEIFKGDL